MAATSMRAGLPDADGVERQLAQVERRLLSEAGGSHAREHQVHEQLALARARFSSATVRLYLPILVERVVRRQLSWR